ncbi:alanine/ornithine racemase family PLP-dependent enzyme [Metamycoplasma phocicerebrale]|uniref:Alanine/ornithine racemase family PLP-dependent enzyme n=1 Tax=Metamycoplasma phocicerebrale TaxID=142649 RepID=A0A3T0TUP3_9BACT|nr:alanine/ornithine racemase family PLP-dependent enzyme [Metamycoplasma phocicerebrale]AZZ65764.1 alanine/ornithine racemase family PLP-dependent enzyme [Metamycoplasma phocicerebrale]
MNFPKIVINETKFKNNVKKAIEICRKKNIEVLAVTKGFCGNRRMAELYYEAGIKYFGDSRLENFEIYKDIPGHKQLLRIPMISEIPKMLKLCDSSLNGDIEVIKKISDYVLEKKLKVHEIVLMVDLGDRREGCLPEQTLYIARQIQELKGVKLIGLGCNFGCYGARIPSDESMAQFVLLQHQIEKELNIKLTHISGGNSLSLHMVWENRMPKEVNFLRMGFAMIFGTEDMYRKTIEGMHRDAFRCEAEVIEVDYKSSLPVGACGVDAFGHIPHFDDIGDIKRILLAIGKLDTMFDAMIPYDKDLVILGGSSDHMIINAQNSKNTYKAGDIIKFNLDWGSLLYLFNSKYVKKEFEK